MQQSVWPRKEFSETSTRQKVGRLPTFHPFMQACSQLFTGSAEAPYGAARYVQGLLAAVTSAVWISLLPGIARALGVRSGAGALAAIVLSLCSFNFWLETSGSWEQPASALLLIGIVRVAVNLHDTRWNSFISIIGIATLAAVSALLSPVLLAVMMLILIAEFFWHAGARAKVTGGIGLVVLFCGVCAVGWGYRNHRVVGAFIPLRSNFGLELCQGNWDDSVGVVSLSTGPDGEHVRINTRHPHTDGSELTENRRVGEVQYMADKMAVAKKWIRAHPRRFVELCLQRDELFWFPTLDLWEPQAPLRAFRPMFFAVISVFCWLTLARMFVCASPYRWIIFSVCIGCACPYVITHIVPRYAYPIFGLATLLACDLVIRTLWDDSSAGQSADRAARPY